MTKLGYSHIEIVLDRSGSMWKIRTDVVGGYNEFVTSQQKEPGKATYSLTQFSSHNHYEVLQNFVNLKDARLLTSENYIPNGNTALLDAIGKRIVSVGEKLSNMKEEDRPSSIIFVIYTDGEENDSKEYNKTGILAMIKEQEEMYNWRFLYLSSDPNAFHDAGSYGINMGRTMNLGKSGQSTRAAYSVTSCLVSQYRSGNLNASFSEEDRKNTA
jgi:hypothetical protein